MKKSLRSSVVLSFLIVSLLIEITACNQQTAATADSSEAKPDTSKESLIKRGNYLVTFAGCSDCHSPKKFTSTGPVIDSARLLSGYPAGGKLPKIDMSALQPGNWALMGGDATAFVGPWGISFAANLTSDSATGLGAWSEEVFVKTLQTGKHLGHPDGRDILPPMPWYFMNHLTAEDFKAVYTYLQSLPAVNNRVPEPVSPAAVAKMFGK